MECPVCLNNWNPETTIPKILKCGHSLCQACVLQLYHNEQISCPSCTGLHIFKISRLPNESELEYSFRCIESLPRNFTLLSLVISKPSPAIRRTKTSIISHREFRYGMKCPEHNLMIHSYTAKPFSMLCDKCIQEISSYKLQVHPFPQVVEKAREDLKKANDVLQKKKEIYFGLKIENLDNKSQGLIQQLEEHFQTLKINLNQAAVSSKTQLQSLISAHDQENKEVIDTINKESENIEKITGTLQLLMEKDDAGIAKAHKEVLKLVEDSVEPLPEITCPSLNININLNQASIAAFEELLQNSFSFKFKQAQKITWKCGKCLGKMTDGEILCTKCECFRPLESYPNLISNPNNATQQEIIEIQKRREIELEMISNLDVQSEEQGLWYIINADWIADWKNFIFNKTTRSSRYISPNEKIGVLPPGPITNNKLFTNPENPVEIKSKLKPVAHYRGVNENVWNLYLKIYGGGPEIVRRKLNIYEDIQPSLST
ncbi:unnamed protein product [Blepharisma stoltei]|uniref:Uncharacterized protein n=1 Tax=Blepharisma stoltei TaxID=1481888 RepID=A0AAU9K484_9CILI|nr:unnamed protein product [Blepharisma stoltei]